MNNQRLGIIGRSRTKTLATAIRATVAGLRSWRAGLWVGAVAWGCLGQGHEVVVVYNSALPESKALAEYYAERRQVPAQQVFGFALSTNEHMTRGEFRDKLQKPLARALERNQLWRIRVQTFPPTNGQPARVEWRVQESRIRYAVLCYGVPLFISSDPNLLEPGRETLRPEMQRDEAAVDSELACLPFIEQGYPLSGPLRNTAYTTTNWFRLHPTNGVLMVARLDGPTPDIARGLVDKALQAERDGLWGRGYFDLRALGSNDPMHLGNDWIRGAADIARVAGFETVVDEREAVFPEGFPMSHIALYAGWYASDAAGPFARPTVEFMPGAFAYHIHSFSASSLRSTNRHWVGPLLAHGVTATMGAVAEPYLQGTPDMGTFFARFLIFGFGFGEAAYAAQSCLSWQITVVGDPLYRPFVKTPPVQHAELEQRNSPLLEWSHLKVVNLNLIRSYPMDDVVVYLEDLPMTRRSAVLTEKLADLYAAQGKPVSAIRAYRQALALNPSKQQRVRLLWTLADKLLTRGDEAEAWEGYDQFTREFPDYPVIEPVRQKFTALGIKLGKLSPPPPATNAAPAAASPPATP